MFLRKINKIMNNIEINDVFLVSLWKLSVDEVISKNYNFNDDITKIALSLIDQKISKQELELLEEHNWLLIEVEASLVDASAEELEEYLKSYFDEINRNIAQDNLTHIENETENNHTKEKEIPETFESFLNLPLKK